jgi:hypothetical protein
MAGLCAPLSTLRQYPRGHLRMTRGRCGSLLLHRDGLAPSTPCQSPGALRLTAPAALAILQKNGNPSVPQSVTTASTRAPLATVSTRATIRLPPLGEVGKAGGSELHNASPTRDSPFNVVANSSTNRAILRDCALLTGWIAKKVAGSGSNGSSTVTSRPAAI